MLPDFVMHYYFEQPFRSLTALSEEECARVLEDIARNRKLPRRLQSEFYFQERRRYEALMHEQFLAKGGKPKRPNPNYATLGESEIWAGICPNALRIPLADLPAESISFTYTDSFAAYVDRDLEARPIPRKPPYEMVYRLDELEGVFQNHGWPGERWKTDPDWQHDLYVEVQLWDDVPVGDRL